ncbi:hypothetical protein KAX17_04545, partial [Candidatus Bipolaricaulota bacterium]|nr:hypothetical protein [Candidatus Bipolaricaulota bacterium]
MSEPQVTLIFGDPYRCERALAARHTAILTEYTDTERHTLFGDEFDMPSLRVELQSTPLFALGRHFVVRHTDAIKETKRFAALIKRELPPSTFLTLVAGELKASNPLIKAVEGRGSVQA